ncbi:unnamed protein product [Caretta caretta]
MDKGLLSTTWNHNSRQMIVYKSCLWCEIKRAIDLGKVGLRKAVVGKPLAELQYPPKNKDDSKKQDLLAAGIRSCND